MYIYQTEEYIAKSGNKFKVELSYDECCGKPWEENDGHGAVSKWTNRSKKSGELILCQDRDMKRYYDFKGAVATARVDGCGGERAHNAAMSDFKYLREFIAGDWWYCYISVVMLNRDGTKNQDYSDWLGGCEDSYKAIYRDNVLQEAQMMANALEMHYFADIRRRHTTRCAPCLVC
jgi:hypothetical protein